MEAWSTVAAKRESRSADRSPSSCQGSKGEGIEQVVWNVACGREGTAACNQQHSMKCRPEDHRARQRQHCCSTTRAPGEAAHLLHGSKRALCLCERVLQPRRLCSACLCLRQSALRHARRHVRESPLHQWTAGGALPGKAWRMACTLGPSCGQSSAANARGGKTVPTCRSLMDSCACASMPARSAARLCASRSAASRAWTHGAGACAAASSTRHAQSCKHHPCVQAPMHASCVVRRGCGERLGCLRT